MKAKVGDTVRVSYEGVVESASGAGGSSIRVNGTWHYTDRSVVTSVEIITPALQVGWHEVFRPSCRSDGTFARYWDGSLWSSSPTAGAGQLVGRDSWVSIKFLGGACDE